MVFGVGELQKSIIERAHKKDLFVVGIDPSEKAYCKNYVDAFEIVGAKDFNTTLDVARKYEVGGILTAATDKPLVMMAKIAEVLHLPFFSIETAISSTDKLLMKEKFQKAGIQCARGELIDNYDIGKIKDFKFPVIVKPRDNSGSRGVIFCNDKHDLSKSLKEVFTYTTKDSILLEEYIPGKEYSVESIHFNGETKVIQYTEKIVTPAPYNVELGHIEPADISTDIKRRINILISKMADVLGFQNCVSHTELKVNSSGIFIIETSPRLGGDFITSHLVPLSTGVNIEDSLIDISLGGNPDIIIKDNKISVVRFFNLEEGLSVISQEGILKYLSTVPNYHFTFKLKTGEHVPRITNSLTRYGEIIYTVPSYDKINDIWRSVLSNVNKMVKQ
jgi:carbamoyl-phosphate synthase large subunit